MEKINNEEKTSILKNEIILFTKLENFFEKNIIYFMMKIKIYMYISKSKNC